MTWKHSSLGKAFAAGWFIGAALIWTLWGILLADGKIPIETGVIFGAGFVSYVLVGVNAWFLHTLLDDLRLNRTQFLRSASPYLIPTSVDMYTGERATIAYTNAGLGIATNIRMAVFYLFFEKLWALNDVIVAGRDDGPKVDLGWTMTVVQGEAGEIVAQTGADLPEEADSPWGYDPNDYFVLTICYDALARRHERWFRIVRGEVEEIVVGPYQDGSVVPPGRTATEIDETVDRLRRNVPVLFEN